MIIRDSLKNEICDALNYDVFRFEDFTIDIIDRVNECFVKILYDEYYFGITITMEKCFMSYMPGEIFLEDSEQYYLKDFLESKERVIRSWLLRIKEDMLNSLTKRFLNDKIQKFREEIEGKLEVIKDGYFTKSEGDELRERLEQLEEIILEKDSQEELQDEISKMKEEIEFLKATIDSLTKKKWLKNALVKMWSWGQKEENRKLIESGVEAVKAISQIDIPKV